MIPKTEPSRLRNRWKMRYSLQTLFVVLTLAGVVCAWIGAAVRTGMERADRVREFEKYEFEKLKSIRRGGYCIATDNYRYWHTFLAYLAPGDYSAPIESIGGFSSREGFREADLLQLRSFPEVRSVSLTFQKVTNQGCDVLSTLSHLEELDLGDTIVTEIGVSRIARSCRRLRILDLYATNVKNPALGEILALPNIQKVDARYTKVSGTCVGLTTSGIEELNLTGSQADDPLVESLACCYRLRLLELAGTHVTDKSVPTLIRLTTLERLSLNDTGVSAAGVKRISLALPRCHLLSD